MGRERKRKRRESGSETARRASLISQANCPDVPRNREEISVIMPRTEAPAYDRPNFVFRCISDGSSRNYRDFGASSRSTNSPGSSPVDFIIVRSADFEASRLILPIGRLDGEFFRIAFTLYRYILTLKLRHFTILNREEIIIYVVNNFLFLYYRRCSNKTIYILIYYYILFIFIIYRYNNIIYYL